MNTKSHEGEMIRLEHGSGGALSRELIEEIIYPRFRSGSYAELSDATAIDLGAMAETPDVPAEPEQAAGSSFPGLFMTTDSFVVDPLFFPGGDIGSLAVNGTCNDLAVSGARPRFLSCALILEEGLRIDDLIRVLDSAAEAASAAEVRVVTGDTKVVPAGKGGGLYINTCGVGVRVARGALDASHIRPGDRVIVTAPIGAHGITVLAARERLSVGGSLKSDCANLFPVCHSLYSLEDELRFLRDATRGGVAAVLNEIASGRDFGLVLREADIPVEPDVAAVAKLLGLQPIEIANEGVAVAIVSAGAADEAISALHGLDLGNRAAVIGAVTDTDPGRVVMETRIGGRRIVDLPRGLLLPRIC